MDKNEQVFKYGEKGEKFYIVVKGLLSVEIPNPSIKKWKAERKDYEQLLSWKKDFDKKTEVIRQKLFDEYQEKFAKF
jgi:hypothetical protein